MINSLLNFYLQKSNLFTEQQLKTLNITPLASGANDVFLVSLTNDKKYVIKIPRPVNKKIIDRANEYSANQITADAGINIPFIYYDLESGVNITVFESHSLLFTKEWLGQNINLLQIIALLKQLHQLPIKFMQNSPILSTLQLYQNWQPKILTPESLNLKNWNEPIKILSAELNAMNLPSHPCHNDPILSNFLLTSQNKLYLIDWEYSGNNDPLWDLATFANEAELNPVQEDFFLQQYYGVTLNAEILRRWLLYKVLVDYLWVLWWLVISDLTDETKLDNPISIRFNRFKKRIAELKLT